MPAKEPETLKKKIKELEAIYNEFVKKLNELRAERSSIVSAIIKRIEEKKIQEVLNKLKKQI
ncbi:hypothetical protein MYX06_02820 [Patescibacteria group bacterium AH-259-L05]|nr:hypothetical protein [Patescibacteria group bacterium AH-259-L05]